MEGFHLRHRSSGGAGRLPVVLLHGFTGSGRSWGEEILDPLAAWGPLVVVDLPGHGEAQRRWPQAPSAPPEFSDVVARLAAIPHELGYESAHWIGYSMGGRLALAVAVEHPLVASCLVLEGASPGLGTSVERAERRRRDDALANRILERGVERFVDDWMELPLFASQKALPDPARQRSRRLRLGNDPQGLAAALRGMGTGRQPSYWDRLGELRQPVLLMTGALDSKFEAISEAMATRISRAHRVSIPGAGHTCHLEAPQAWTATVRAFLDPPQTDEPGRSRSGSETLDDGIAPGIE